MIVQNWQQVYDTFVESTAIIRHRIQSIEDRLSQSQIRPIRPEILDVKHELFNLSEAIAFWTEDIKKKSASNQSGGDNQCQSK